VLTPIRVSTQLLLFIALENARNDKNFMLTLLSVPFSLVLLIAGKMSHVDGPAEFCPKFVDA